MILNCDIFDEHLFQFTITKIGKGYIIKLGCSFEDTYGEAAAEVGLILEPYGFVGTEEIDTYFNSNCSSFNLEHALEAVFKLEAEYKASIKEAKLAEARGKAVSSNAE